MAGALRIGLVLLVALFAIFGILRLSRTRIGRAIPIVIAYVVAALGPALIVPLSIHRMYPGPPGQYRNENRDTFILLGIGWTLAVAAAFFFQRWLSRRQAESDRIRNQDVVLRGSALTSDRAGGAGYKRGSDAAARTPVELQLGQYPIARDLEEKHFLFAGTTGAGKTQGINAILSTIRARSARAIVADAGGSALTRYFQDGDLVFNPLDARSVDWSPFADIRDDQDCANLAKAAIPDAVGDMQEWRFYAQSLLTDVMRALVKKKLYSVKELLRYMSAARASDISDLLTDWCEDSSALILCMEGNDKMLSNTRAVAAPFLASWRHLSDKGSFSVRDWVRSGAGWLFITYRDDQFALLRTMIGMVLDLAIVETLCLPELDKDEDHDKMWFVMDEVDSLGKVSNLKLGLTKLRKYGGKCVMGLQTISQLRSTYGKDDAQTLMGNIGTKIVLRAGDGETAEYFSAEFGNQEIRRMLGGSGSSISWGRGSSISTNNKRDESREVRKIVLDSEISGLADLHGFIKMPPAFIGEIELTIQKGPGRGSDKPPPFVAKSIVEEGEYEHVVPDS